MSTHYFCIINKQQILINSSKKSILIEDSELNLENKETLTWKEVKTYHNGTQKIYYTQIPDDLATENASSILLSKNKEAAYNWVPLISSPSLDRQDLVTLAYITEAEILDPNSDPFWIDLAKILFNTKGQFWSPLHLDNCLRKREKRRLIQYMPNIQITKTIILSILLGLGLDALLIGKSNGVNALIYISLCVGAITYVSKKKPTQPLSLITLGITVALSLQFALFNNPFSNLLNILVMPLLLALYTISLSDKEKLYFDWHSLVAVFKKLTPEPFSSAKDLKLIANRYTKNTTKASPNQPRREILLGLALSIPVLLICGALLASSDAMFNRLVYSNFSAITSWLSRLISFRGILVILMTLYAFGYLWSLYFPTQAIKQKTVIKTDWNPLVIITLLISTNLMYLVFTGIQISYLYMRISQVPQGFSYAEYARQGFFQLFFVAIINISLSSLFITKVKATSPKLDIAVKGLNTLMCLLTLNLLFSSFYKLCLYEQTFGFTHLRLWVQCFSVALGLCLLVLMLTIWKPTTKATHLCMITLMTAYTITGFIVNDHTIAKWNIEHYADTNKLDIAFLSTLSVDATEPIFSIADPDASIMNLQTEFKANHRITQLKKSAWYEWNYFRSQYNSMLNPNY